MDRSEVIIFNECANAGDKVYTYCDDMVGAMEAFGYSAYLASSLLKDVLCLWDEDMQLPCAVLRKEQMDALKKLGAVDELGSSSAQVQVNLTNPTSYDRERYDQWLQVLKSRKSHVAAPVQIEEEYAGGMSNRNKQIVAYLVVAVIVVAIIIAIVKN